MPSKDTAPAVAATPAPAPAPALVDNNEDSNHNDNADEHGEPLQSAHLHITLITKRQ